MVAAAHGCLGCSFSIRRPEITGIIMTATTGRRAVPADLAAAAGSVEVSAAVVDAEASAVDSAEAAAAGAAVFPAAVAVGDKYHAGQPVLITI